MAKQKEEFSEYKTSSGNVFADLELEQSEELLVRTKLPNDVIDRAGNKELFKLNWAQEKLYQEMWYCNLIL